MENSLPHTRAGEGLINYNDTAPHVILIPDLVREVPVHVGKIYEFELVIEIIMKPFSGSVR